MDSCLGRSSLDRPNISEQSLYLPFRADQPIEYEPIQWQTDPSSTSRFVVQPPPSPNRILQPRNEPNTDQQINNTNVILLDENDDQNYVDANGDEENEAPKPLKKKGKKKKQQAKIIENTNDASIQLNTSSNRTSTTGQKLPVNIFFFFAIIILSKLARFSKNYHQNGQLVNAFPALVLVKQVRFVK